MKRWLIDFLQAVDDANARLRLLSDVWALTRSLDDLQGLVLDGIVEPLSDLQAHRVSGAVTATREEFRHAKGLLERVEKQFEMLGAEVRKP